MTDNQKQLIDKKDAEGLQLAISTLHASNHKDKAELIAYAELRLERLNRGTAMVEQTEIKQSEFFQ